MSDPLQGVGDAVRVIVERIDAPFATGTVVRGVADPVNRGIAHVDVGTLEIDLQPQHMRAIGEFALLHPLEQVKVLLDAALAIAARTPRLGQCAAQVSHFLRSRTVDVSEIRLDQVSCELVETVKIVGRIVKVRPPVVAQPAHRVLDRLLVLDVLLNRIGVIETKMAGALVLRRKAEVEADGLRMADVKITIGFRRKPRDHPSAVFVRALILGDDLSQKVGRRALCLALRRCSTHRGLFMNKCSR